MAVEGVNWGHTAALIFARPHEWCRVEVQGDHVRIRNAASNLRRAMREAHGRSGWEVLVRLDRIYARFGGHPGLRGHGLPIRAAM